MTVAEESKRLWKKEFEEVYKVETRNVAIVANLSDDRRSQQF